MVQERLCNPDIHVSGHSPTPSPNVLFVLTIRGNLPDLPHSLTKFRTHAMVLNGW